jgi:hypothetical protein
VAAAGGVAVLNVLHALGLVRVREPVLAHVQVVAEAAGGAGHEDLGDGERGHDCGVCRRVRRVDGGGRCGDVVVVVGMREWWVLQEHKLYD